MPKGPCVHRLQNEYGPLSTVGGRLFVSESLTVLGIENVYDGFGPKTVSTVSRRLRFSGDFSEVVSNHVLKKLLLRAWTCSRGRGDMEFNPSSIGRVYLFFIIVQSIRITFVRNTLSWYNLWLQF